MCLDEKSKINKNSETQSFTEQLGTDYTYKHEFVWKKVLFFSLIHVFGAIGVYKVLSGSLSYVSIVWFWILYFSITESVTAGVHRCYTHRSYKASPILRACFIFFFTMAGQNSIFIWVRDHRLHHKYSDTDGDPHNSNRGFFFSHMGWLMMKKHPRVVELGRTIDMSDLKADAWVMWQYKYFYELFFLIGICLPVAVPIYFGETWINSIIFSGFFRYALSLHITWLVNSVAHFYGTRPYDKDLRPVETWFASFCTMGEGWHNYHHVFPWDYQASELGMPLNFTSTFIRFCEKLGLAYDLKTASSEMIEKRLIRTGDGTHHSLRENIRC